MPKPCAGMKVEANIETRISNRRCRSTCDAARQISQTRIESSLPMVHASSRGIIIFLNQGCFFKINSCTSRLRRLASLMLLFPPARFHSIFVCNDKNITRRKATMACRNASQKIFFFATQCSVCFK